ncbi:MAG: ATP-binding protein [Methanothrix sp.]
MGINDIPKDLPKCELIRVLAEKVSQRDDIEFYVLGRLDEFRQRVSGEVRQINQLFPEYTPHDEQYHLKRLFYVADTVLGKNRIEAMNAGELFVLAVALYGHDWGMAVNEIEKNYIITNEVPNDKNLGDLWILPDEKDRFRKFARDQQLIDSDNKLKDIPIEKWREYVRRTHAFRSGARIRKFFEPIDGGVADAAARVCIGHWLNFEDLQDHDSYPINYSVMRDQVNLRALAVYLRLIDLLDLAEDRTPYVIWKFVAPRDSRSKMAWDKHRALRSVTCPSYQEGRVIRVDGSTDSHEVYAALEDLRIWCETQFRGCNDLLARMNDPRHKLDIYHIDWHVEARGFKKTSIGFQFDRERMFEILGNEIYQGDPYVFLRELLQNSIDAIRMRREILRKYAKIEPVNLGVIRVTVRHQDNNDAIITWRDDGIGMDEYIIQNYLAVAGKSYYRSQDFEKVGLEMDPISRFGIGILSCFIVADSIEIETYKDPILPPKSEPLKVAIPDQGKRFRVEVLPEDSAEIGTTIKVFIRGKKISKSKDNDNETESLDVTGYLAIIAGFVEFPIIIDEDGNKTIILHPKENAEAMIQRFGKENKLHQINLKYPWSEAILPQDISIAQEQLQENCFDLTSDLGMEDYEGILTYLVPSDELIDFSQTGELVGKNIKQKYKDKRIRCEEGWSYATKTQGLSRSSTFSQSFSVYRDGILIPSASRPNQQSWGIEGLPHLRLVANLSKKKAPIVDLSRTNFCEQYDQWFDPIFIKHIKKLCDLNLERLLALDPFERIFQMGRIIAFNHIRPIDLWEIFPHDHWPVLFMQSQGKIKVEEYRNISKIQLFKYPIPIDMDDLYNALESNKYDGFLIHWMGNNVLIDGSGPTYNLSMSWMGGIQISNELVKQSFYEAYAKFIHPPWEGNPPLIQSVLRKEENSREPISIEDLLERGFENPKSLELNELFLLNKHISRILGYGNEVTFINFSKPFDNLFAYGSKFINIKHPSGQDLLRFICCINSKKMSTKLSRGSLGKLEDSILNFLEGYLFYSSEIISSRYLIDNEKNINYALGKIWLAAKDAKISSLVELEDAVPEIDDFVPGTVCSEVDCKRFYDFYKNKKIKNFGYDL